MSNKSISKAISELCLFMLFLTFLVLKLTKVVDWSWWWITAHLWGSLALVIIAFGIYLIIVAGWSAGKAQRDDDDLKKDQGTTSESKFMRKLREAQERSEAHRNSN